MTQKESLRCDVIQNLIASKIEGPEAAKQTDLSTRQVRRLKSKVKKRGIKGIIHGNRGKESNNKIPEEKIKEIESIIKEKYYDSGPTFATEKLYENHQIIIGKERLRLLMIDCGLREVKPRRQSKQYHSWRARKDNFGEMQQFDGSYHLWLEDRHEELCLLLSIDDATGRITGAKFDYNESILAVFRFWLEYFAQNGLPVSIYLDKFSTYKINHKNAVDNKDMITQFERAMNQVGVKPITAHSPEAKGRVERMFGTLQDRLVKEMRLRNISTIKEANEFLKRYIPKFNAKFAVVPTKKANLHQETSKQLKDKLPQIFSIQNERKVNNDYTVMFKTRYFQLDQEQPTTVYKKRDGLYNKDLVTALRAFNLTVKEQHNTTWNDLTRLNTPNKVIIVSWMKLGYIGHFSVVEKVDKNYIILADPQEGKHAKIEKIKFMRLWMGYDEVRGWYPVKNTDIQLRWICLVSRKSNKKPKANNSL